MNRPRHFLSEVGKNGSELKSLRLSASISSDRLISDFDAIDFC
jgi:hypothetical protein